MLPGSVKVVLAWDASARAHSVQYVIETNDGRELFFARRVTVNPEYTAMRVALDWDFKDI